YGSYDAVTLKLLQELHMKMVLWTSDTEDYLQDGVRRIVRRALIGAGPGAIVLMHDGGGDRAQTAAALPKVIDALRQRGYKLVNLPTLLRDDPPPVRRLVPFSACPRYAR